MFSKLWSYFQRIKDQSALVFSNITAALIGGLFWIYLASILEKDIYGELGFLLSIVSLGSSVALIGLPTLIIVYGAKKENIYSPAYSLGLISALIVSLVSYFVTQNFVIGLLTFGFVLFSLFEATLNSKKKYLSYSINNISRKILVVIFVLALHPILGLEGILLGYFIATAAGFLGLYNFFKSKKISITTLKPKLSFMIHSHLSGISGTLMLTADKLIIGSLMGFSFLGSYTLAIQPLAMLQTVPSALIVYLLPKEAQGLKTKKIKFYTIILSCIMVIFVIAVAPYAIDLFVPKYQESIIPMQVMMISIIPITISMIQQTEFLAREKSKFVLIGSSIHSGMYLILIPIFSFTSFGLPGIAYAFLFSSIIRVIYNILAKKIEKSSS